jgi:secreted trypsin-like serine protease
MIFLKFLCIFPILIAQSAQYKCGQSTYASELIVRGTYSDRGQFPWLGSLFYTKNEDFYCGATLISEWNLLSAAHCFNKGSFDATFVLLGHFNIDDYENDKYAVKREIEFIVRHPEYEKSRQSADGDIAALRMDRKVSFTNFIQPICLPSANSRTDNILGVVAGYGKSEFSEREEKFPKHVQIQSISLLSCYLENKAFIDIASERSFCAGGKSGTPCKGQ